jgi:hypothetical protein
MRHTFAVGQSVTLVRSRLTQAQPGNYEVLSVLPDMQYRIKSVKEGPDRVAQERDLRSSANGDLFAKRELYRAEIAG